MDGARTTFFLRSNAMMISSEKESVIPFAILPMLLHVAGATTITSAHLAVRTWATLPVTLAKK
jgi:hypothetical protein